MAELGDDLITYGGGGREVDVTVEMMDYAYVDTCEDVATLRAILRKLKAGEGGRFPHLEAHVEERLMARLPAKERNRILRLRSRPNPSDIVAAEEELAQWQESVKTTSGAASGGARSKANLPPP
eukprot:CAMPEP_0118863972 /NCGR_PEP_ID=MMETSP1163-20130328/8672_1 /TAXON_ID=124430 /ORGANISM="Phaeomonas parva, Strain CCMP2877" /LENGTH=123 /DNA_ID=CAMNT_0006798031 /DNA_START=93 /DNA_END=460 /DNA_ORIENTATION=-